MPGKIIGNFVFSTPSAEHKDINLGTTHAPVDYWEKERRRISYAFSF